MNSIPYLVNVPNVVGRKLAEAEQVIKGSLLCPVFFPTALTNLTTSVVASQEPEPGTDVPVGSMVVVHPTDREQVAVPDVVGWSVDDAVELLQGTRLRPVFATPLSSSITAAVASLEPEPGLRIPVDSLVLIRPSSSDLVDVPDVVGWTLARAEEELKRVGLVPEVDQDIALSDWTTAVVDYLKPPRGTSVQVGKKVVLVPKDSGSGEVDVVNTANNLDNFVVNVWMVDFGPSPDPWKPD